MAEDAKAFAIGLAHKALALQALKRDTVAEYLWESVFTKELAQAIELEDRKDFWYCDWAEWYNKLQEAVVPLAIAADFFGLFESTALLDDIETLVKPLGPPVFNAVWLLSAATPMEGDELEDQLEKIVRAANKVVSMRAEFIGARDRFLGIAVEEVMGPAIAKVLSRSALDVWGQNDRVSKKQKS